MLVLSLLLFLSFFFVSETSSSLHKLNEQLLFYPLTTTQQFNPITTTRTKPIIEFEQEEQQCIQEWNKVDNVDNFQTLNEIEVNFIIDRIDRY